MPNNRFPRRKSPRLAGYDYSRGGAYFITICTHQRQSFFGTVVDEEMRLSPLGQIANDDLATIPSHYQPIDVPVYIVMPNHVHAIITIEEVANPPALGVVVGNYKAGVTRKARRRLSDVTVPLWQTSYHDHIIRNARSYEIIHNYILQNPVRWQKDTFFVD